MKVIRFPADHKKENFGHTGIDSLNNSFCKSKYQMLCSKYIPQPDLAFKMYCWRDLSRPDINSGSKTACMGIGNKKKASRVSSTTRKTSTAERANPSLFACGFHVYRKEW